MAWSVYLIVNQKGRTYVGSTTDVARRLRQHNGELKGGARATKGYKWKLQVYLEGFPSRSSACRWERIIKNRTRGAAARIIAMEQVWAGICPGKGKKYIPPTALIIWRELYEPRFT